MPKTTLFTTSVIGDRHYPFKTYVAVAMKGFIRDLTFQWGQILRNTSRSKWKLCKAVIFLFSSKNTELSSENSFVCQVRVSIAVGKHFFWAMLKSNSIDFCQRRQRLRRRLATFCLNNLKKLEGPRHQCPQIWCTLITVYRRPFYTRPKSVSFFLLYKFLILKGYEQKFR